MKSNHKYPAWFNVKGEKNLKGAVIEIYGREWFDKVNGNSYHCAYITIFLKNGKTKNLIAPFQYGYGDQYEHTAYELLIKYGYIKCKYMNKYGNTTFSFFNKHNIRVSSHIERNCLKKQLATKESGK